MGDNDNNNNNYRIERRRVVAKATRRLKISLLRNKGKTPKFTTY